MRSNDKRFPQFACPREKRTLKRCSTSREHDDFVLIEVDSDNPAVIIVDVPESVQKKLRMPSARNIISIDDDEVSGEQCSNDNGTASSSACSSKLMHSSNSAEENESRSGSTGSDHSDGEWIDGPAENIREQWELASKRRKNPRHTGVSGNKQASTCSSQHGHHSDPSKRNAAKQPSVADQFNPTCAGNDGERNEHAFGNSLNDDVNSDPSSFVARVFSHHGASSLNKADAMGTGLCNNVEITEEKTAHDQEAGIVSLHGQEDQKAERDNKSCHSTKMEADGSTCAPSNDFDKTNDVLQNLGDKSCQINTVTDRHKIKETDEYKRAMEELQASRQQQLQIQAEEAQRLRRRKRAESTRLMDMERRQKLRLEEMREAQKKDEANLNMKEQIRADICKKLIQIESSCVDMASLLGRLGLLVSDSRFPSKNEVLAAYKRGLLKFHPDRASRTDIRQQVEAEEKFKLISRMKEKFCLA